MSKTKIEWAERSWNPITGCTKISTGCKNCYAERMSKRLAGRYGYDKDNPFKITFHPNRLEEPLRWRKPQIVFVCSMGDLFHEDVDDGILCRIFDTMFATEQHTFLILTKRPERMKKFITKCVQGGVAKNVWLGVTVENQEMADKRIPILLQTPAAKRFVSVEPMLGEVTLWKWLLSDGWTPSFYDPDNAEGIPCAEPTNEYINWVICGGETGHGARPMHPDWAKHLRDQCIHANVPFFFKQWGEYIEAEDFPVCRVCGCTENEPCMMGCWWIESEPGNFLCSNCEGKARNTRKIKVCKVGRKSAGRELDGREWNERPAVEDFINDTGQMDLFG